MWVETSKRVLVNLEHVQQIQVVGQNNQWEVRGYPGGPQQGGYFPLASYDTEKKAQDYYDELRIFMSQGRPVIAHKRFTSQ